MEQRLTISLPDKLDRRLKKFARSGNMSTATAGRMAIDFLITVLEKGVVPTGDQGTVNYILQQLPDVRANRERAQRRGKS